MPIDIKPTQQLSTIEMQTLIEDSRNQGFLFVERCVNNWIAQKNCFNKKGEVLLIAKDKNIIVGLCGLNIDPYHQVPGLGRVRHLYVLSSNRRQGIGSQLIKKIIYYAQGNFDFLNLRTYNAEASNFYLAQGFQRCYERPECTHILRLKRN